MEQKVRVRFAPSPTGPLHIGGVRTALYNYLFAKKHNGDFLLRIEDTDQDRFVPGAEEYIIEALSWCGISFDEGVGKGGPYSPYRQSERSSIYSEFVFRLVEKGLAYYAFDTPQELDKLRTETSSLSSHFQYDSSTRYHLRNSLTIAHDEVQHMLESKEPYVIRILIPPNEQIEFTDLIRGTISVDSNQLDDKVLYKSDGLPTYHLANVVDDYLMKITHVIRGEEWLPSTPLHVLLYRYLGFSELMPRFAHLPLLLRPDGNGKLSKRDGDRLGFPVFPTSWSNPKTGESVTGYRESGFFPDAFINFLALLGWNPGGQAELFSMQELISLFSLERVSKSGARFDYDKARWFNQQYLRSLDNDTLLHHLTQYLNAQNIFVEISKLSSIIPLIKDRAFFISDLWNESRLFFFRPATYDTQKINQCWKPDTSLLLEEFCTRIKDITPFNSANISSVLGGFVTEKGIKHASMLLPLRISLVGVASGPDLFSIMELLGKSETIGRIMDCALRVKI